MSRPRVGTGELPRSQQRPEVRRGLAIPMPSANLAEHLDLFRMAEALGYDDLWTGDNYGPDGFTPLAAAAAVTSTIRLGTGIVNTFTRGPAALAQQAAALADLSGGRFVLGLGSSSSVIVEQWNGIPFRKPLTHMRQTIEILRPVLAGGRGLGGFRLDPPPTHPVPIVVAALREKMLGLAAELGDGCFLHAVPLSGMAKVLEAYDAPSKELICRLHCIPGPEDEAMEIAKRTFLIYALVPVYFAFFEWLGWGEALAETVDAWRAGDRRLALERCPEDLVREIYIFGSPAQMNDRIEQFIDAGVSTVVLGAGVMPDGPKAYIRALAPSR